MADNNSTLAALVELRNAVEARLKSNPDYKELQALRRAIADITGEPAPEDDIISMPPASKKPREAVDVAALSQADASHVVLTKVLKEPVIVANLVKALAAHGVTVGGNNPNINLSSVLSKDTRFRSVRYKDRASWWVHGTPFPGELDAH